MASHTVLSLYINEACRPDVSLFGFCLHLKPQLPSLAVPVVSFAPLCVQEVCLLDTCMCEFACQQIFLFVFLFVWFCLLILFFLLSILGVCVYLFHSSQPSKDIISDFLVPFLCFFNTHLSKNGQNIEMELKDNSSSKK